MFGVEEKVFSLHISALDNALDRLYSLFGIVFIESSSLPLSVCAGTVSCKQVWDRQLIPLSSSHNIYPRCTEISFENGNGFCHLDLKI